MLSRNKGFTLIEVMIVVIILGVLASIAIPQYQKHVIRSNRTEGKALLTEAATRQERYFTQNNKYADTVAKLGYASANSQSNLYTLTIAVSNDDTNFTLTATPINAQTRDTYCNVLGVNDRGTRTATGSDGATECWK